MPRAETFRARTRLNASPEVVFDWHARPGAFERLAPPWQRTRLLLPHPPLAAGNEVSIAVGVGPFNVRWLARIESATRPAGFIDVALRGPFAAWRHEHRFAAAPPGSVLEDLVEYRAPLGGAGRALLGPKLKRDLGRLFRYRHVVTKGDLAAHAAAQPWAGSGRRLLVSGAGGFIGRRLVPFLENGGHEVVRLVRRDAGQGELRWDPLAGELDATAVAGFDAVIHLAGEPVAQHRWSGKQKRRILESREKGTRLLAEAIARAGPRPPPLVMASGIGFHGDSGDRLLDENSPTGDDFLAAVCSAWEEAAVPAREAGARVVALRLPMVLDPSGGALAKLLPVFHKGLGGRIGSGKQWVSWIALDDALGAVLHALATPSLNGPLLVVAPEPLPQNRFAATLGHVLRRPTWFPLPGPVVRLCFGEMGEGVLLAGQRAEGGRLVASGFAFRHPRLEGALRHVLGRTRSEDVPTTTCEEGVAR